MDKYFKVLFTKPILDLNYSDLDNFFGGSPVPLEGLQHELKRDLPNHDVKKRFAKNIAAFANSMGGIVFIGIDEISSTDGVADWPPIGVSVPPATTARRDIDDIIKQYVMPYVHHETTTVPLSLDPSKHVVIVRIFPDTDTPHEVDGKIRIRGTVGDRPASPTEISTLRNRETTSKNKRKKLICETLNEVKVKCIDDNKSVIIVSGMPKFPEIEFLEFGELEGLINNNPCQIKAPIGITSFIVEHGPISGHPFFTTPDSVIYCKRPPAYPGPKWRLFAFQLTRRGQVSYVQNPFESCEHMSEDVIPIDNLALAISYPLLFSCKAIPIIIPYILMIRLINFKQTQIVEKTRKSRSGLLGYCTALEILEYAPNDFYLEWEYIPSMDEPSLHGLADDIARDLAKIMNAKLSIIEIGLSNFIKTYTSWGINNT